MTWPLPIALRLVVAMLLSALLLWAGFSAWILHGDNYQRVQPDRIISPNPADWRLMEGAGALTDTGMSIDRPGLRARWLLAIRLPDPIRSDQHAAVEVRIDQDLAYLPLSVNWSRSSAFTPTSGQPMTHIGHGHFHTELTRLPDWRDEVYFIGLESFGAISQPFEIQSIRLIKTLPDFGELQQRLLGDWIQLPAWNQRSAHNTRSTAQEPLVSPLLTMAAWAGGSALLLVLISGKPRRQTLAWTAVPVLIAWLLLDLRWQANLLSNAADSMRNLAGATTDQKARVGPDALLQDFLDQLPDFHQDKFSGRVLAFGRNEYWRTRARYHLLPWSIRTRSDEDWSNTVAQALDGGDVLLLLDAPLIAVTETGDSDIFELYGLQTRDYTVKARRLARRHGFEAFVIVANDD